MTPPKPQSTIASELDNPGGVTTRGPRLLRQVIVKYVVNWPNRLREMASFVGLEEEDHQLIQDSAGIVMDNAEGLTEAVYDNFLKFPESRRFFLTPEGEIDHDRVARRKHSLVRWLRGTTKYTIDESFAVALLATGISHSHPPTHRAHLGPVPSRHMIGAMSFTQTVIGELLRQEISDPKLALKTSAAWNKLLILELDILLAGYLTESTGDT